MPSFKMVEYVCRDCDRRFERLEDRSDVPGTSPCECGGVGESAVSATHYKTLYAWADSRGKSDERPPWAMDTRDIARRGGVDV